MHRASVCCVPTFGGGGRNGETEGYQGERTGRWIVVRLTGYISTCFHLRVRDAVCLAASLSTDVGRRTLSSLLHGQVDGCDHKNVRAGPLFKPSANVFVGCKYCDSSVIRVFHVKTELRRRKGLRQVAVDIRVWTNENSPKYMNGNILEFSLSLPQSNEPWL